MELLQWISKYFRDEQFVLKTRIAAPHIFIQMCTRLQSRLFLVCDAVQILLFI